MKCPRCLAVALDSDTVCVGCKQPLVREDPSKSKRVKLSLAGRLALAFALLGAGIGPVVGYAFFFSPQPAKPGAGGNNWAVFVAAGAGLGALIGYFLGVLVFEKEKPKFPPPPAVGPEPEPEVQEAVSEPPAA